MTTIQVETSDAMGIADAAGTLGLSAHTLRYYERIGLIGGVPRDASGQRRYRRSEVEWLRFLSKLRATGMGIRDMQRYAELVRAGDGTAGARRRLLVEHREAVRAQLVELTGCLELLDRKIANYESMEACR